LLGKAAADGGLAAAAFGLALHYSIMLVMVGVFVLSATRLPTLTRRPVLWGLLYGLGLYLVMNWIVLPLRWPETFGAARPISVANQVFANLILVGLPISLITARRLRRPAA
ncbi:MAG TPA: hypothetical protein VFW47_08200, partial [Phenylobacterium sp.]|nr:hypothetical protein [Phenylobacterium sp.]